MAMTAAQYQSAAETALTSAKSASSANSQDKAVAQSQIASAYAYLYIEQARLDAGR